MSNLNETPSGERVHIGFFGVRNAGKSSLINAITGQAVSVVSDVPGTTTDPVRKAMELLPLGPVLLIDTPGIDDTGTLGQMRVERTRGILARTDVAVLVASSEATLSPDDLDLIQMFERGNVPYLIARTKADVLPEDMRENLPEKQIYVSALTGENIHDLKERIAHITKPSENTVLSGLVASGDTILLIVPIDDSAPKGRLILPQQRVIREALDSHCTILACQPDEIVMTLRNLVSPPKLVITDSQAFELANRDIPENIALTSFSLLFARCKGDLAWLVRGASKLAELHDGDKVLISEGCTHHRQCGDIGSVKIPAWIEKFCGVKPEFSFTSGGDFPEDVSNFSLVVHCGGCMLNNREMKRRMRAAAASSVPMVNYGAAIAQMHGVLLRAVKPFLNFGIMPEDIEGLK